jgi:hypothetical protein
MEFGNTIDFSASDDCKVGHSDLLREALWITVYMLMRVIT